MLNSHQKKLLEQLLESLNEKQNIWLSGYISGRISSSVSSLPAPVTGQKEQQILLFYATETGNSRALARMLEKQARSAGIRPKVSAMQKLKPKDLETLAAPAVFLVSTHGEGDPPESAQKFFKALYAEKTLKLDNLNYAVLGLGDKAYSEFCKAACDLEEKLKQYKAKVFYKTTLLDVDYQTHAQKWIEDILKALPGETHTPAPSVLQKSDMPFETKGLNRLAPLTGTIMENINLNDAGSDRKTHHIEIACDRPLPYTPGDAAGILLPDAVREKALAQKKEEKELLTPRLYSIASSPIQNPNNIHLTVALATHALEDGSIGHGVYSHYLCTLSPGDKVRFYVQRNLRFSLPEEEEKDIIMIGAGTGIAPFRGFLQDCEERQSIRKSWLFFGNPHQHTDFLYQKEWQDWLEGDVLTRIDLAFSRDQEQKIYVQHRLKERADDLLDWLDKGACLYVCGAQSPMSEDVEKTLLDIAATRQKNPQEWLEMLSEQDRYIKDVY